MRKRKQIVTLLILAVIFRTAIGQPLISRDPTTPMQEKAGRDTIFTTSGEILVGEIVGLDEINITLKRKKGGRRIVYRHDQIEHLSTRPWTILMLNGSVVLASIVEINANKSMLLSDSADQDSLAIKDIGAIYTLQSSISEQSRGAATGALVGTILGTILVRIDASNEGNTQLGYFTPVLLLGGGIWGHKIGSRELEPRLLFMNPMLLEMDDYKSGIRAGRESSAGHPNWFFKGLTLNLVALKYASEHRPIPPIYGLRDKTSAFIVGYIEGYGEAASVGNFLYSTVGAAGNSMGILVMMIIAAGIYDDYSPYPN